MYIWIEDEVFISSDHILCIEEVQGGYHIQYPGSTGGRHVDRAEGERIIALLQRDSVGQTLKIGRGQTINPQDVTGATLYGEGEEFQVIILKIKGGGKIEVGTAWDLVGYEIVHNHFLKNRPPFSASDWAFSREEKKVKELEEKIKELEDIKQELMSELAGIYGLREDTR